MKGNKQSPQHISKRFAARTLTLRARVPERFWENVRRGSPSDCWEWLGHKRKTGYGYFYIGHQKYSAHRVSFYLSNPGTELKAKSRIEGLVLHSCDNRLCVNPSHLRIGTALENAGDRKARGRDKKWRGAEHPLCKLTAEQVIEIRNLRKQGITGRAVAKLFNVSPQTISAIMVGRFYSEVPDVPRH